MELYLLASFVTVARTGSLSQAATLRNISLSGISKHIKLLEEEFGFALFTRRPRGMELSKMGAEALLYAEKILHQVDNLEALSDRSAKIRIGVNISPDFLELSRFAKIMLERYPEKKTLLTHDTSRLLLQQLEARDLDLCLAFGDVPEHFRKLPVCTVQLPLMIPLSYGSFVDIESLRWIVGARDCPFQKCVERFWEAHGIFPHSSIVAKDSSQKEMVSQGLGAGFLELQDGLELFGRGLARRHTEHFLNIALWVVYSTKIFTPVAGFLGEYVASVYANLKDRQVDGCAVCSVGSVAD